MPANGAVVVGEAARDIQAAHSHHHHHADQARHAPDCAVAITLAHGAPGGGQDTRTESGVPRRHQRTPGGDRRPRPPPTRRALGCCGINIIIIIMNRAAGAERVPLDDGLARFSTGIVTPRPGGPNTHKPYKTRPLKLRYGLL
eukprot:scaffold1930_cov346-Prasinococcus_capsulatus_cf.AAC.8